MLEYCSNEFSSKVQFCCRLKKIEMLNPEEPITDQEVVDPGPDPLREMLLAEMNQIPELVQSNNQLQRQRVSEMDEQRRSLLRRLSDLRNRRINKKIDVDEDGENEDPCQEHSLGDKFHSKLFTPEDLNQNFLKRREKVSNTVFKKDENHIELCKEEKAPKIVMRRSRSSNSWSIRSSQDQDDQLEEGEEEDAENIPKIYMKRIGSSDSWAITN